MTRAWQSHEVTRIRGELTVTPEVTEVINEFLEEPVEDLLLYTTAQHIMPALEYRLGYNNKVAENNKLVEAIGRRTLVLGAMQTAHVYPNESARLFFSVRSEDQFKLDQISSLIGVSASGGKLTPNLLYAEFLPNVLSKNELKIRQAMGRLAARLHHPSAARWMHTNTAEIITKNMPDYAANHFFPRET